MTAKYLYLTTYENHGLRERFRPCHCPMDGVALRRVAEEAGKAVDSGNAAGALESFAATCALRRPRRRDWVVAEDLRWSRLTRDDERYRCFQDAVWVLAEN